MQKPTKKQIVKYGLYRLKSRKYWVKLILITPRGVKASGHFL